jgi:TolB-like protein
LQILLENASEPVSREEFRRQLWPSDTFVDFEHGLNTSVKELRAVLSDSPDKPRYIETLPKLGYRFLAEVRQAPAKEPAIEKSQDEPQPSLVSTQPRWPASRRWVVAASITAILAAGLTLYLRATHFRPKSLPKGGRVMLAVLPFDNLTGDVGQDYFSDGLTEEMITQLGRLNPQRLGVIARTSVMHYKHSQEAIGQIGRDLGVQYVLEGSVRRDSGQMRITAQLIQVNDQTHLWAGQYNRELKDLLLVQGEIAREVSDEIQIAFDDHKLATPMVQPPVSPQVLEAHNLYLQGLYFWNKRTLEGFEKAIDYFQRAISKDPNSARAYAGLADSYILLEEYSFPQPELIQKGRVAALRALEIDPNLAEAHTALALIVENFDWDWETAEKEYRRAIELDPNYATAHHWYAEYLMWLGRFDEALHESELARQLDPLSLIIAVDRAEIFYFSRQYDRAIEQFRYVRAMDPEFPHTGLIVLVYLQKGMLAEAEALLPHKPIDDPHYWATVVDVYYRSGQQERARHALEKLLVWSRSRPVDPRSIVSAYLAVGDKDKALASLEKAYAQHSSLMVYLKVDPMFDPLRSDSRFQRLIHGVGLDR